MADTVSVGLNKPAKPVDKTVRRQTNKAKLEWRACFDWTDLSVFESAAPDTNVLTAIQAYKHNLQ